MSYHDAPGIENKNTDQNKKTSTIIQEIVWIKALENKILSKIVGGKRQNFKQKMKRVYKTKKGRKMKEHKQGTKPTKNTPIEN